MALHVFMFVFLLVVCLLLSLTLLWRLSWLHQGPASTRAAAKRRSRLPCLRHRHAPQTIAPPVDSPPLPRRGWGLHLHQYVPGVR
jgi:hypothetical protein